VAYSYWDRSFGKKGSSTRAFLVWKCGNNFLRSTFNE
jgi:hypothetical protein